MDELRDFFKKAFGKEKDTRAHAISMLAIYGIFMVIAITIVRSVPYNQEITNEDIDSQIEAEEKIDETVETEEETTTSSTGVIDSDINYSYSYTITFDGETEVYLGKRIDDKQKFSYIKDGVTLEYAILDDNYLVLEDGTYILTDTLDTYFKYCDIEKILELIENVVPEESDNYLKYNLSSSDIANVMSDTLTSVDDNKNNSINIVLENGSLRTILLNFDSYISNVLGESHTLNIRMDYADIGTVEDFEIKIG